MSWLYVPGSADLNSALPSPSAIGERLHAASVTWRGKPQQPQAWSRRWKQGGFIRLLSGLTLEPSTADRGVASFISSLREIHARTTAWLESAPGRTESGSSPPKSFASPRSAGLILSSVRTCRGTRTDSLKPSSRHWKGWATALRQEYSARPRPEIPCGASDCSSWQSAKTSRGGWERDQNGNVYPTLEGAAQEWMAPNVPNGGRTANHAEQIGATLYHRGKKVQLGLEHQAKAWPGQAARDFRGANAAAHLEVSSGSLHLDQLPNFVEHVFRLPSSPDQPIAGGSMSSTAGPNSNQPSVKRKLNPIFVEALMRWPTGLSGFERQEMALIRFAQLMPSFLSALCSQREEKQHSLF